jgi:hypothetical protein
MSEAGAETTLTGAGLAKGTVGYDYSDTVAAGLVMAQNPAAGESVSCGSAVDLVISKGPVPLVENDYCVDATVVETDGVYFDSTVQATGTTECGCADNDTLDVWYSYTAQSTSLVNITLSDSDFDTTLAVYDDCGGTELACNDDFSDPNIDSQVTIDPTGGDTYLIRVAGYDGQAGNFTLSIKSSPGLNNDTCVGAIPVEPNEVYLGTTVGATGPDQAGCSYNDDIDVWHSFTPQTNVSAEISLCDSDFDTTLMVFDGCGGTLLEWNDDHDDCGDLQSQVGLDLSVGKTYLIRVAGYDGETGDYTLSIDATPIIVTADLNQDGFVDLQDLAKLGMHWQESEPWVDVHPEGGDGIINMSDVLELAIHWLDTM